MDSIFEEEADKVGGEIEAYCPSPRCKADTTHAIISMYEDEVRRVQCVVCGEVHAFRKPRGDSGEEGADAAGKKRPERRVTWEDALARATEADLASARPYSIRDSYEEGDVVLHPVFDIGFVTELLPENKVEVIFRDGGSRIHIHNRGDLAARMPDISEIPIPREAKKKKRAKKPDAAAAPLMVRSKPEIEAAVIRARSAAQARMDEAQNAADERTSKLKVDPKKPAPAPKAAPTAKAPPVTAAPAKAVPAAKTAPAAVAKGTAKPAPASKPAPAGRSAPATPAAPAVKAASVKAVPPAKSKAAPPAKGGKPVAKAAPAKAAPKAAAKPPAKASKPAAKPAKAAAKSAAKKPAPKPAPKKPPARKPGKKK